MRLIDSIKTVNKTRSVREAPGKLNYNGKFTSEEISIEVIEYSSESIEKYHLKKVDADLLKSSDKNYWINVTGLHDIELMKRIGRTFDFHNMDLEDVVHVSQRAKTIVREGYVFSIAKMLYINEKTIKHEHIAFFIKENVLLTFQETKGDVFEYVRERFYSEESLLRKKDIKYLFYALYDAIVDEYFLVEDRLEDTLSTFEARVFETDDFNIDELHVLRKELLYMINIIRTTKDSLSNLLVNNSQIKTHEYQPYYDDLFDHLNQVDDAIKSYKEMTDSLFEMQMAKNSNDMNKTIMTLTVFSAIFIPLSFLAGVFGMNFTYFPGMNFKYSIHLFIFTCVLIAGLLLGYFRKK
jgi:magnesium transporter